ncbi:MAG TPA: hypothetical protein VED40_20265 [Azospirillaceae bacterium]|nr:hypothetical protein [Azospirillaceae bacterium]
MDTLFVELPEPAARELGADATAPDALTAVPAAQLLYDAGAKHGWRIGARRVTRRFRPGRDWWTLGRRLRGTDPEAREDGS